MTLIPCAECNQQISDQARACPHCGLPRKLPHKRKSRSVVFKTHIAGVTYQNDDGTKRQDIIGQCEIGDLLNLKREPCNPYDPNAVGVHRQSGEQLGHLHRKEAAKIAPLMDKGSKFRVRILGINGWEDKEGVSIEVYQWIDAEHKNDVTPVPILPPETSVVCPDCGRSIPFNAVLCPTCARPMKAPKPSNLPRGTVLEIHTADNGSQLVGRTSKRIKRLQEIAGFMTIVCTVMAFVHHPAWVMGILTGIAWLIIMTLVGWWYHD